MGEQVHAFVDDALGELDGLGVAARIRSGEVSRAEVLEASLARLAAVEGQLHAVQVLDEARALEREPEVGPFAGVPTFVKDNTDVAGLPSNQGSEALSRPPARRDAAMTKLLLRLGLVPLGKSRMPEFGFNASSEFMTEPPVRNPWDTDSSAGASSGGAAALVAAGVVPVAHANDGGGSIRIPAAACGLVGLKPSRGRFVANAVERLLPVNIVGEGVVTRSVRDTAHFVAHADLGRLPAVGLVQGPSKQRRRIGLVLDSVTGVRTDDETRKSVESAADLLATLGHHVEVLPAPLGQQQADDFLLYWTLLGFLANQLRHLPAVDGDRLDGLTRGLADDFRRRRRALPGAVRRLRDSRHVYARQTAGYDAVLTPVLAHTTPLIGYLSPTLPYDVLMQRLLDYVAFTPLNNMTGTPAVSLPMGQTAGGLPIGVHLMGRYGGERVLLEIAFELEEARPFRRLGG